MALEENDRRVRIKRYDDDNCRVFKTVPLDLPPGWRGDVNYSTRSRGARDELRRLAVRPLEPLLRRVIVAGRRPISSGSPIRKSCEPSCRSRSSSLLWTIATYRQ